MFKTCFQNFIPEWVICIVVRDLCNAVKSRTYKKFTYHRIFDSNTIFLIANCFRLLKSICSCRFRAYYWPWNVAKIQKNRMKWLPHERLYYNFIQNNPHVLVRNNSTTAFYSGESIPFLILPFYSDQSFFRLSHK